MPKDDWAKARRKEIGQRALRTGKYCRVARKKQKTGRRKKRRDIDQKVHSGTRGSMRYECVGRHHEIVLAIDDYQRRKGRMTQEDIENECEELNREYLAITR